MRICCVPDNNNTAFGPSRPDGWGSCGLVGGGFESRSDGREQGGREMTAERSAEAGESDFGS